MITAGGYGIELSFSNYADSFLIPVNPDTIEIKESGDGKSYTVAGLGEINVIKAPKLTEISFSGIFPAYRYPFVIVKRTSVWSRSIIWRKSGNGEKESDLSGFMLSAVPMSLICR